MSIAYDQTIPAWEGAPPVTSGSYTPGAAGECILVPNIITANGFSTTTSGTGGTYTSVSNTAVGGYSAGAGYSLSLSGSAQTTTVTTSAGFIQAIGALLYAGVTAVSNVTMQQVVTPGTGPGACLGTPVTVPTNGVLVAVCINQNNDTETIVCFNGSSRPNTGMHFSAVVQDFTGTGASVTPAFTCPDGATDSYVIYQWLLAGGTGAFGMFCATGTYAIAGQPVVMTQGGSPINDYVLLCRAGIYNIVGAPSSSDFVLGLGTGSYSITGISAGLATSGTYTLICQPGIYSITGIAASFSVGGGSVVTVPTLTGEMLAQATATLTALGFTNITTVSITGQPVPSGSVGSQTPPAGSSVNISTLIILGIESGQNVMPNVTNVLYEEAILMLQQAGIYNPNTIGYFGTFPISLKWTTSKLPPGTVVTQIPAVGANAPVNSPITLTISEFPLSVGAP